MDFSKEKIAVIGLGLIGGSLLKALKGKVGSLIGVSRTSETIRKALDNGLADIASTDISIIKEASVVFICTPINKVISTLDQVKEHVSNDCIITDAASLKGFIMDYVNNSSDKINFIGGHPMAGTENKGIDSAVDGLFNDAKWILTPSKYSNTAEIKKLQNLIELVRAVPLVADPYEHDKAAALISHMPMLLSQSLFYMLDNYPDKSIKELALKLASSGFRDMTRLACSNQEMANDMINMNKANVLDAMKHLNSGMGFMEQKFDLNDPIFVEKLNNIINLRQKMYNKDGKNVLD